MYIYERLIGVFTYVIIMFIMILLIYKSDKNKLKKNLIIYLIALCILAFFYIPSTSADLYRYIISAHDYNMLSYNDLYKLIINSSSPMQIVYFYLLGKININGLIPAVSALIYYGCYFRIIYGCAKKYNLSNKSVAYSLFLVMAMGGFLTVISAIRSFVAFAVIALCIYREIIENKSIFSNVLLYLFAGMMHLSAIGLIIIRIIIFLFGKEKKITKKILNILIIIIISIIFIKFGRNYWNSLINKTDYYVKNSVYSYLWEYIICFVYMIYSTIILLIINNKKTNEFEIKKLIKFNLIINFVIFIFAFEYSIFTRFQMFSELIFTPLFAFYINSLEVENKKSKLLTYTYIIVLTMIFIIACTRGNLCGYKYILF